KEPATPWRRGAFARAGCQETVIAVEERAVARHVIENAIEDQANATFVGFLNQPAKCLQIAEERIDLQIVDRVVAVVRARLEDWVQVDSRYTKTGEIVQFLDDAGQVAAEKVAVEVIRAAGGLLTPAVDRRLIPGFVEDQRQFVIKHERAIDRVIAAVAIAEAIRKDLVDDGILHPFRRCEVGIVDGNLEAQVLALFVDRAWAAFGSFEVIAIAISVFLVEEGFTAF